MGATPVAGTTFALKVYNMKPGNIHCYLVAGPVHLVGYGILDWDAHFFDIVNFGLPEKGKPVVEGNARARNGPLKLWKLKGYSAQYLGVVAPGKDIVHERKFLSVKFFSRHLVTSFQRILCSIRIQNTARLGRFLALLVGKIATVM